MKYLVSSATAIEKAQQGSANKKELPVGHANVEWGTKGHGAIGVLQNTGVTQTANPVPAILEE